MKNFKHQEKTAAQNSPFNTLFLWTEDINFHELGFVYLYLSPLLFHFLRIWVARALFNEIYTCQVKDV